MTIDQTIEEPCEVKISSTVLKTSRRGDLSTEFYNTNCSLKKVPLDSQALAMK
jgi:hypothetical protein